MKTTYRNALINVLKEIYDNLDILGKEIKQLKKQIRKSVSQKSVKQKLIKKQKKK